MIKSSLKWINLVIAGLALFLVLLALLIEFFRPSVIPVPEVTSIKTTLPKGAFDMKKEVYDSIGPPLLKLNFSPLSLQLPDLRNHLVYYGRNERPDAIQDQALMHFSFTGQDAATSIATNKPLYLIYDRSQSTGKYLFSPDNVETSLWIEASPRDKEALVKVSMKNEAGRIIREPKQYSEFIAKEKAFSRFGGKNWELGKWKVDGTLLARQKAKWYGKDLFLERHGGEEYTDLQEKQRIDFGVNGDQYSVFLGPTTALIWNEGTWQEVEPSEKSRDFPLLVINQVDERLMKLDLWEVDGKSKVSLNLIKSSDKSFPRNIQRMFKFVGARTRTQMMFEVDGERMLLSPQDWLIYLDDKWYKLTAPEDIDAYVNRELVGPLFVVDEIIQDETQQVLKGTLFNSTRTEIQTIEIPLQQGAVSVISKPTTQYEQIVESNKASRKEENELQEVSERKELEGYRRYHQKFRERDG